MQAPPQRQQARQTNAAPASFDDDRARFGCRKPVVAAPAKAQRAALGRGGEECDERISRDRRRQFGAEDLFAVIAAGEPGDDVARDEVSVGADPKAALHRVRDQRLDLDDLAALGLRRDVDQHAGHRTRSSTQAAIVTITSADALQNDPSLISATATLCCESASLIRVDRVARPARGPIVTEITCGCGFFSLTM